MDGLWIFLNLCLLSFLRFGVTGRPSMEFEDEESSTAAEGTESSNLTTANNEVSEIQLFPVTSKFPGQTRQPRKFFSKLNSGAAFFTGFKLGNILAKKGFELGSGQIASTHNFQLFGKNVNSAMSLSYGNSQSSLPLVDDTPNSDDEKKRLKKNPVKEDVFLVTVIETSSIDTPANSEETVEEKNEEEINGNEEYSEEVKTRTGTIKLYQEVEKEETNKSFLEEHNDLVKKVNEKLTKRNNSKF